MKMMRNFLCVTVVVADVYHFFPDVQCLDRDILRPQ